MKQDNFKIVDEYFIATGEPLGGGMYGKVYKGYIDSKDESGSKGKLLAIKETPLPKSFNDQNNMKKEVAIKEINIMKKLDHPNIIQFIDAKKTDNNIYLIMEYCDGGSLESFVKQKKGNFSESECLFYFREIIDAFRYLRANNMVHRDVKPENVLLHEGQLKLADFGFAREIREDDNLITNAGTPLFQDPAIAQAGDEGYSVKSDIFSLGVLLFWMIYYDPKYTQQSYPWYANSSPKLVNSMLNDKLKFPNHKIVSQQVKDLISSMLKIKAEERIDWKELFDHPLLKSKMNSQYQQSLLDKSKRFTTGDHQKGVNREVTDIEAKRFKEVDAQNSEQVKIKEYTQKIERKNYMIQNGKKCIERLDHERNVVLLIYMTATRFIDQIRPHVEMDSSLAMKLMYVLTKRCLIIIFKLKRVVSDKSNEYKFPEEEWHGFINIPEHYEKAKQKIEQDFNICQQNFQRVLAEAQKFQDHYREKINDNVNEFDEEFNDMVIRQSLKYIGKNLIAIKNKLVKDIHIEPIDETFLFITDNLLMIYTYQSSLQWKPNQKRDFQKFYDERKMINKKYLLKRIIHAYEYLEINKQ